MRGIELKEIREKNGWTQQKLADKLGKTSRTIILWEQSENLSPSQERLIRSVFTRKEVIIPTTNHSIKEDESIYNLKEDNLIEILKVFTKRMDRMENNILDRIVTDNTSFAEAHQRELLSLSELLDKVDKVSAKMKKHDKSFEDLINTLKMRP